MKSLLEEAIPIESPLPDHGPDLIEGILKRRMTIAGETNVGKSLVALEMVASMLTGQPLWGSIPVRKIKKALYILSEHDRETIQELWQATNLNIPPGSLLVVGPETFKDHWVIVKEDVQHQVIKQIGQAAKDVDVVVYDPLSAFIRGREIENDNTLMRLAVDLLFNAAWDNGAAGIILHHHGKPSYGPDGKKVRKGKYASRGASSVPDANTHLFNLEHFDEDPESGLFSLVRAKVKGQILPNYLLSRDPKTLIHTLLDTKSPQVEVKKLAFAKRLNRFQSRFPHLTYTEAVEAVSFIEDISPRTGFRWLAGEE
jgi:RecA-family ATPase